MGHINLLEEIPHPLDESIGLRALPVTSARIVESKAGAGLAPMYEEIVAAVVAKNTGQIERSYHGILRILLEGAVVATQWNFEGRARLLARGTALAPIDEPAAQLLVDEQLDE